MLLFSFYNIFREVWLFVLGRLVIGLVIFFEGIVVGVFWLRDIEVVRCR